MLAVSKTSGYILKVRKEIRFKNYLYSYHPIVVMTQYRAVYSSLDDELPVSFARWNLARQVKDILHENNYSEIRAEPIPRFASRDQSPRIEYYGIDDLLDSEETSRRLLTVELGSVDVADRLPRGTDYTGTDSRNIVPFKMVHWHHDSLSELNPRYQDSSSDEA